MAFAQVMFKSVEDAEVYYGLVEDMVQGANAEELVLESQLVDCSGFRGSLKAGIGECVLLFNSEFQHALSSVLLTSFV